MKILKHLEFRDGFVYLGNSQCFFRPLNVFLVFHHYLEKFFSEEEINEIFDKGTLTDSFIFYNQIIDENKDLSENNIILKFLEYLNLFGFGEVKLKYRHKNKIIFSQDKIFASIMYKNSFGKFPNVKIERILMYFIKSLLSILMKKQINCKCIFKNYRLTYEYEVLDEEFEFNCDFEYDKKFENNIISQVLKGIIYRNLIKKNNGLITVTNIEGFICPYYFSIFIMEKMYLRNEKLYEEFMIDFGRSIGKSESDWLIPKYDMDKQKTLKKMIGMSNISGIGSLKLHKNNRDIEYIENYDYYKKYFNPKSIDNFKKCLTTWFITCYEMLYDCQIDYKFTNQLIKIELNKDKKRKFTKNQLELYNKINLTKTIRQIKTFEKINKN